jgi:hypothetical protein
VLKGQKEKQTNLRGDIGRNPTMAAIIAASFWVIVWRRPYLLIFFRLKITLKSG